MCPTSTRAQRSRSLLTAPFLAGSLWERAVGQAVALVAPPRCASCRLPATPDAILCAKCMGAIERLPVGTPNLPRHSAISERIAAFPLEGPARDLVYALKYRSCVAAAREMAWLMAARIPQQLFDGAILVPAPAHPQRRRSRGYNQAAVLALELGRIVNAPVCDFLVRNSASPPQTGLPRAERLSLPSSAISIDQRALAEIVSKNRADLTTNVVLLDDVTTTGVTLEVCAAATRERFQSDLRAICFASTSAQPGRSTRTWIGFG